METITDWASLEAQHDAGVYQKHPVAIVRGLGTRVWDAEGTEYLDAQTGYGVANVGHSNPVVVEAIKHQAETLMVLSQTIPNDQRALFFQTLTSLTGPELNRVFPTNSGTEANEAALKFARVATGRKKFVAAKRSFHGRSMGSLSVTWEAHYREPFAPLIEPVEFVTYNRPEELEAVIDDQTAALILEPVQGEGGVRPATQEYLGAARRITQERGALLIMDEVQTGFGRTGKMFAYQHYGIVPDILTLAKAMAGGVPIGACVMTDPVAKAMPIGGHGTTFGGNPLAMAAAVATMNYIRDNHLPERAAELGEWFFGELAQLDSSRIREVRGKGLMIGIELKERVAPYIAALEHDHKILSLNAGPNVIRLLPPLIISQEELGMILAALRAVLA